MKNSNFKTIQVTLSTLKNGKVLRKGKIEGIALKKPKVNSKFIVFSRASDRSKCSRVFITSIVEKISKSTDNGMIIRTENYEYLVEMKKNKKN